VKKESNYTALKNPVTITEQDWLEGTLPILSVFNWVYNHKDFIRESIESVLIQKTSFPVEIIIHDDASNDGTREIIIEYQEKYPRLFRNILHKENQWSQGKSVMTPLFEKPNGKYIALTHGDDYWNDPYKLQKQVDFLEANEDYVASFHDVKVLKKDGILHDNFLTKLPKSWETIEDLARYGQYIQTNTFLFRNVTKNYPEIFNKFPAGDFALQLYILQFGKIKYFPEVMSVYRYQVGVHSSMIAEKQSYNFHTWLLPLWLYFSSIGNKSISLIMIQRIYEYLDTIKGEELSERFATFLCEGMESADRIKFINDTIEFFENNRLEIAENAIHHHMKESTIAYILKVVVYKLKVKIFKKI
jgi:glycosyltransferase involved in cell wall biosynthesis